MATTDARTGFRLPWSAEDRAPGATLAEGGEALSRDAGWPVADLEVRDSGPEPGPSLAAAPEAAAASNVPRQRTKPSKFLADLTKAMQATAEAAREDALGRLQGDAKTHIEQIHALAADEATALRRRADDDVAAVREWSKAEIARIREETETRITDRKALLEREIDENAALIERRIERVQATVDAFEAEMAAFFERLLLEEDPTRFATLAENLPEPPALSFDTAVDAGVDAESVDVPAPPAGPADVEAHVVVDDVPATEAEGEVDVEAVAGPDAADGASAFAEAGEAPFAFGASDEGAAESTPESTVDAPADDSDPRVAVLGLTPDSAAAAEAEAFAAVDDTEDIPVIADDALAARLSDLVPNDGHAVASTTTDVVVTGLVSVASIASFKRHLGRVPGVHGVGVTSGPDGEFVFSVGHGAEVVLRDAVPSLPGFQARVTGGDDHSIAVTAHDPETNT